jgi:hypothetical protein
VIFYHPQLMRVLLVVTWRIMTFGVTLPDKGILEKLTSIGKSLAFYIVVNKVETLNKP